MALSRSAVEFLKRAGLSDTTPRPSPRLNATALLIHTVPLASPPKPLFSVLEDFEGDPPPDRAMSRPWPGQPGEP